MAFQIDYDALKEGFKERIKSSLNALEVVAEQLSDPLVHGEYVTEYLKTRKDAIKGSNLSRGEIKEFDEKAIEYMLQFYGRMIKLRGIEIK